MRSAALAALALLAGCGGHGGAPSAPPPAAPPPPAATVIEAAGTVDNRRQRGHAAPMAWLVAASLAPEGTRVAPGDVLAGIDATWVERWEREALAGLAEAEASAGVADAQAAARRDELRDAANALAARRAALRAAITLAERRDADAVADADAALALAAAEAERAAAAGRAAVELAAARHLPAPEAVRRATAGAVAAARLTAARAAAAERAAVARQGAELRARLAQAEAEAGDAERGLAARRAGEAGRGGAEADLAAAWLRSARAEQSRRLAVLADPAVRAAGAGVLRWRRGDLGPGAKLPVGNLAYVLEDGGLVVRLGIPEDRRAELAPWDGSGPGPVLVQPANAAGDPLPARLLSLGASPVSGPDGRRVFPAVAAIDGDPGPLRIGMQVRCLLPAAAAAGPLPAPRISGVLEADVWRPLRLRSRRWDVEEIVPDGALVQAGQTVARLSCNDTRIDPALVRARAAEAVRQAGDRRRLAEAAALLARLDALDALARAEAEAAIAGLAAEAAADAVRPGRAAAQAEDAAARAAGERRLADLAAADLDDDAARTALSRSAAETARARARAAALRERASAVRAAAARRGGDLLAPLAAAVRTAAADGALREARAEARLAASVRDLAVQGAADAYAGALAQARRDLAVLADEVVEAPLGGRIFHRPGRPLAAGDALDSQEPLRLAVGPARRLALELPADLAARFRPGQQVPVLVPCLGGRVTGTVVAVGTVYGPPAALRDDPAALATAGQVCDLVLRLDLDQRQGDIALPGSAAHVAL